MCELNFNCAFFLDMDELVIGLVGHYSLLATLRNCTLPKYIFTKCSFTLSPWRVLRAVSPGPHEKIIMITQSRNIIPQCHLPNNFQVHLKATNSKWTTYHINQLMKAFPVMIIFVYVKWNHFTSNYVIIKPIFWVQEK